jgi:outer membrane protein OmpA-like peptidoglycan-associated protein
MTIPADALSLNQTLFPEWITTFRDAIYPVISGNDSIFIFTLQHPDGNRILESRKKDGLWPRPVDITSSLGKNKDMFSNSITDNGLTLIIARNDGIDGDLYISWYKKGEWTRLQKLNKNINTPYWEAFGHITGAGDLLYFSSNKPGGYGSLDIYSAKIEKDGTCGPARNLGPTINSKLEEDTPFFEAPGNRLWFSSTGHEGYGGYDIFQSTYERRWSKPVHLEYPLNTSIDNVNYIPYPKEEAGLISLLPGDTSKWSTIYLVKMGEKVEFKTVTAKGNIKLGDGLDIDPQRIEIKVVNTANDQIITSLETDSSGYFEFEMIEDSYNLHLSYPGYSSDTLAIVAGKDFTGNEIRVSHTLIPTAITRGEFLKISTILFGFDKYSLTREAQLEIEKLIPVLIDYPYLRVELKGYTDAIGSKAYNLELSRKRAAEVAKYMEDSGIVKSRLIITPVGAEGFMSNNRDNDGKDNPEGRRYNRRVSINIINDGYYVPVETYSHIPRHLRNPDRYSFYVVLHESDIPVGPGYFKSDNLGELAFIKELKTEDSYIYVMGEFLSRTDALNYVVNARSSGFTSARIITEYDLPNRESTSELRENKYLYTIQIHALSAPTSDLFPGLTNVRMIKGSDGWYRYVTGEYYGYSRAVDALKRVKNSGYPQAFIKELSILENQTISR